MKNTMFSSKPQYLLRLCIFLCIAILPLHAQLKSGYDLPMPRYTLPDGRRVIEAVKEQIVGNPMRMKGELRIDAPDEPYKVIDLTMRWEWPVCEMELSKGFGVPWQYIQIQHQFSQPPSITYWIEGSQTNQVQAYQATPIKGLGISAEELSLGFLWWEKATTKTIETRKTRRCYVVELTAPNDHKGPLKRITLWADKSGFFIVHAEGYDAEGRLIRTIEGKKLTRKYGDRWMVSQINFTHEPNGTEIEFRLNDLEWL